MREGCRPEGGHLCLSDMGSAVQDWQHALEHLKWKVKACKSVQQPCMQMAVLSSPQLLMAALAQ